MPGRRCEEADGVVGEMSIQHGKQRFGVLEREIVDEPREPHVVLADDERRGRRAKPVGVFRIEPGRAREPRCDRPVALFGDAEESAPAGKQPIVVDDGRRARRGKKARKRACARIGRTEHGCWQVERAGNDQSQVHGKRGRAHAECSTRRNALYLWHTGARKNASRGRNRVSNG